VRSRAERTTEADLDRLRDAESTGALAAVAVAVGAVAVGAFAVPVGIGLAGPHLAKTGASPMSLAGLVVLLGGLVLFGAGLNRLARSERRARAVAGIVASIAALLVLTWSLGQAVAATNVPRTAVGDRTPTDVGLSFEDVTFPASDGVALSGWYVPSRAGAAVVLLHGAGSTRSEVLAHAAVLARHGYGVLLYDARGHGRSRGRAMDFGWFGDRDVAGAVAFLRRQPTVDPDRVAAVGLSMGGEEAIGAAASVAGLRAVVAEGATNRVAGDKAWLSQSYGFRGAVTERIEGLTYAFADLLTSARPPITLHDAAAAVPVPMLLIAAGSLPDEAHAARYVQDASPSTVAVWVAPGAALTSALRVHPGEWERRVVTFLDAATGPNAGVRG
jgi:pimeloyl-ACP methyl ester carboxylesterase